MKIALSAMILALAGCSVYAPDAGHEVVLVDKPWFFGHGGVESEPVKTGRTWAAMTTEGVDVYMQPQKFDTELPDTMTSDGVPITFHALSCSRSSTPYRSSSRLAQTGTGTTWRSSSRRWCARRYADAE